MRAEGGRSDARRSALSVGLVSRMERGRCGMGRSRGPNPFVARQSLANRALGVADRDLSLENRPTRLPEEARSGFLFVALQVPPRTARIAARRRNSCAFRISAVAKAVLACGGKSSAGKGLWRSCQETLGSEGRRDASLRLRSADAERILRWAGSTRSNGSRILLGGRRKRTVDYG